MAIRYRDFSTAEAFISFHKDLMLEARTAIPGKITGVNQKDGALISVDVQIAIQPMVTTGDNVTVQPSEAPIITGVPFVIPRSQTAGFSMTVPIVAGDDALLVFSDRSIDNWQNSGRVSPPVEPVISRTHDITDAIAIIGVSNDVTGISDYDMGKIMLRNKDKSIYMSVSNSAAEIVNADIKITLGGGNITLQNGASSITIASNKITISSPVVEITGGALEMASTSNTTTGGGLSSSGGLDFDNHVHSDPQGGLTGPPQN